MEVPRKRKPRKILFVDQIDQLLKLTEAQLKVWLYHFRREGGGDGRKSWASRDTVGEATGFSRPSITHARTRLMQHGWLKVVGYRPTQHGGHPVREYRCLFPMAQGKASDPLTDPQSKTSDPLQGKASDPGKVNPAAPEVKSPWEVTAAPTPGEVFRPTNSDGNEQTIEQAKVTEAAPPTAAQTAREPSEPFEAWLNNLEEAKLMELWDKGMKSDPELGDWNAAVLLVNAIQPIINPRNMRRRLIAAWEILRLMPVGIDALDVLTWNRAHKKGLWYLRSCTQFLAALRSEEDHLLNDYTTDDSEHCKTCKEHKLVSWTTLREEQQEREQEAERKEAMVAAEARRLEELSRYDLREPTQEEADALKPLLSDGWTEGCVRTMITPRMWSGQVTHPAAWKREHAGAAMLFFLKLGQPVTWDAFGFLVEQIKALDTHA
jgi:hypothetical protein